MFVRESKNQPSRFYFELENPNLGTNIDKLFRAFFGVLELILKQGVLAPFLAMCLRVLIYKRGRPKDLPPSAPLGLNIGLTV